MPSIDLDSSSDGGADYTTTNVTLGYASQDATGDDISHLGGHPTWLDANYTPPATLAKCRVCGGLTSLLLLLNADLQQYFPNDERRLHVLCCRKKACSKRPGTVRTFREVRKPASRKPKPQIQPQERSAAQESPSVNLGTTLFGGGSIGTTSGNKDPFSMSSNILQPSNPFSALPPLISLAAVAPQKPTEEAEPPSTSFADKLKISDAKEQQPQPTAEPWPETSAFPSPFRQYCLDAASEELESEVKTQQQPAGPSKTQYDTEDASVNALDRGNFESDIDKTFQKFSDRIAQNPEQVLRYEFKGQPLLYSGTDDVGSRFVVPHGKAGAPRGIPRCDCCGGQRVFEVQLVPGLIYELEEKESLDLDDGMEWGTIIVTTCVNNCGEAGEISFREEWAGVQWEDRVLRK